MRSGFISLLMIACMWLPVLGQDGLQNQEFYGKQAEEHVPGAALVINRPGTTFPVQVRMSQDHFIPLSEFEAFLRTTFNFSRDYDFVPVRSQENKTGLDLEAFQLTYQGIPVEHAVIIAHAKNGMIGRFNGFAGYPAGAATSPGISETDALRAAISDVGAKKYMWEDPSEETLLKSQLNDDQATYYPKGQLILVEAEPSPEGMPSDYRLAWKFEIREQESILDRTVLVDAHTGEVIRWYSLVYNCDAGSVATTWHGTQTINTDYDGGNDNFLLLDDCVAASVHTILEAGNAEITDGDNNWTEAGVTDYATSHFYGRVTINYFDAVHNRDSYDDADGDITLRHVASWANGQYIGSGIIRLGENTGNQGEFYNTLDVVAHEFTHGVTDNNGLGGLTYQGESGALNESFSDILGETAEMWFENGAYTVDWLHREDYVGGANRSMWNPNDRSHPDTYQGDFWAPTGGGDPDFGGVHTNSGVMNYWFYLLTMGGTGTNDNDDDFSVDGIGVVKTREIAYRMLTEEMTSNATYADARNAAIAIATDIYGSCANETRQVRNAWYAVGVGDPSVEAILESPLKNGGYNLSCFDGSDGAINLTILGTGPFTFEWDDAAVDQNRSGLIAGTYGVTVTDATGCSDYATITLTEPPQLIIDAGPNQTVYYGYPPAACATLSYAGGVGGVPPYTYEWSTGESTQDIEVCPIASTEYTVTITDANGCQATDEVNVCVIDVRCGKKLDKVELCHFPPENPANNYTICVGMTSVIEHLMHGDMLAACGTDHSCTGLGPKSVPADDVTELPGFELKAVPNPFSESTLITFSTENDGHASLRLVDFAGRLAGILFDQAVQKNYRYQVEVNGDDLAPGLYYGLLMQGDGSIKVIKLVLKD